MTTEIATLGGGCFWCTEAVFDSLDGVLDVVSGYAGGARPHPSYEDICTGTSGHAEVVRVTFDPARLPFADLLRVFFATHDPTTLNRQGADVGTQYRSTIMTHSDEQARIAREIVADLTAEGVFDRPIVTEVVPAPEFFPAEAYHQEYYARNPRAGYCQVVISPKVAKLRAQFAHRLKVQV